MSQLSLARWSLLVLALTGVFFGNLGSASLWDRDEPRNARASQEMLERNDWVVPTFNDQLRAHKPILIYWTQMASYRVFGVNEFAARMPSAMAAILASIALAVLATRLSGCVSGINATGFWSAIAFATCTMMVMAGRAATPDSLLVSTSTMGITFLVIGTIAPIAPYSSGGVASARWLYALAGYLCFGLAVLAKGPVGIVLPLAVVHVWWLVQAYWQSRSTEPTKSWISISLATAMGCLHPIRILHSLFALRTIPGLCLVALASVPWYYAVGFETQGEFLRTFFWEHNVGRAMNAMEGHRGSILYYPIAFLVGTFPWSLWLVPILIWATRASRENVVQRQLVTLGTIWVGVYVVAFSLASTKLPSYITPCYAGAALIIGSFWKQFEATWHMPGIQLRRLANAIAAVCGGAMIVAIVVASRMTSMPLVAFASMGGVALMIAAIGSLYFDRKGQPQWIPSCWLVAAVAIQISLFGIGASAASSYRTDLALLKRCNATPGLRWIAVGTVEPSWVYYLGQSIKEYPLASPDTWDRLNEIIATDATCRLIVTPDAMDQFMQHASSHPNLSQLLELGRAQRFLKEGDFMVMQWSPQQAIKMAKPTERDMQR